MNKNLSHQLDSQDIRKSSARGNFKISWLNSMHTFSFGEYYDPQYLGHSALRVINEDKILGGQGFATHGHQNMEIISYVISGALKHKDSMGNETIIKPGEVQIMSAGTGIQHSEYNYYPDKETHFYQIWILPKTKSLTASYGQRSFQEKIDQKNLLTLVVSPDKDDQTLLIHQEAKLYIGNINNEGMISFEVKHDRTSWIQIIKGPGLIINGEELFAGDGIKIKNNSHLEITSTHMEKTEFFLFDLPLSPTVNK